MAVERIDSVQANEEGSDLWRGVALILVLGVALGITQNVMMRRGEELAGLKDYQRRSLDWIREKQVLASIPESTETAGGETAPVAAEPVAPGGAAQAPSGTNSAETAVALPVIPSLPQPMEIQLAVVKAFVDQEAAAIIDARPRDEFAQGHIPGAVSMPYDEAVTDPARLESFDAKGRPIIVYCGGGTCESSKSLAYAMLQAGQKRLVVFTGGFPEWSGAGYPVATASEPGKDS